MPLIPSIKLKTSVLSVVKTGVIPFSHETDVPQVIEYPLDLIARVIIRNAPFPAAKVLVNVSVVALERVKK